MQGRNDESVMIIYGKGCNYYRQREYGQPIGMGVIIGECILTTCNSVLPSLESAVMAIAKVRDREFASFRLDPERHFFTNASLGVTIVGFKDNLEYGNLWKTANTSSGFTAKLRDNLIIPDTVDPIVTFIREDVEKFIYEGTGRYFPGAPLFNLSGELQGIHLASTSQPNKHEALKITQLLSQSQPSLISEPPISLPAEVTFRDPSNFPIPRESLRASSYSLRSHPSSNIYYTEERSRNIYSYNLYTNQKTVLSINNLSEFLSLETLDWKFSSDFRIVTIEDDSIIITGGEDPHHAILQNVYHYIPQSGIIRRLPNMLQPRKCHSILYSNSSIYVVGGIPHGSTCEKYSIPNNTWSTLNSCEVARYNSSLVLAQNQEWMYLIGGMPQATAGYTIERYNFQRDQWETLRIRLRQPVVLPGLWSESNKILILGGGCKEVYLLEYSHIHLDGKVDEIERLHEMVSTKNTVVHDSITSCLIIINELKESWKIIKYHVKSFISRKESTVSTGESPFDSGKSIVRVGRLMTPEYRDSYF
jgi:hypothetical protein